MLVIAQARRARKKARREGSQRTRERGTDGSRVEGILNRDDRRVETGDEKEETGEEHEDGDGVLQPEDGAGPRLSSLDVVEEDPHGGAEDKAEQGGKNGTNKSDKLVEEGNDLGDDEGERDHSGDRRDPGNPVDLSGLLQVDGTAEQTDEEELDGQVRVDDGSGKETGESDSVCDLLDQRAC